MVTPSGKHGPLCPSSFHHRNQNNLYGFHCCLNRRNFFHCDAIEPAWSPPLLRLNGIHCPVHSQPSEPGTPDPPLYLKTCIISWLWGSATAQGWDPSIHTASQGLYMSIVHSSDHRQSLTQPAWSTPDMLLSQVYEPHPNSESHSKGTGYIARRLQWGRDLSQN